MEYLLHAAKYLPFGTAASLIFLGIHEIGIRARGERVFWFHRIVILLLGVYLTVVFALTVSPIYGFSLFGFRNKINLTPFQALATIGINPANFWGNILLFLPLGVMLVLLSYRCQKLYVSLLIGAGLSTFIEVLQLFGSRNPDIDDILLNTVGTVLGYFTGRFLLSIIPSIRSKIGILIEANNQLVRKRKDTKTIPGIALFVLIAVFAVGFWMKTSPMPQSADFAPNHLHVIAQPNRAGNQISKTINARNAYLWNVSTNTVLFEKESTQRIASASTAKMLTALTVLDYCREDDEVLVGSEITRIAKDASRAWLNTGNRLNVRQLLDAMLLPSGNDAAYSLSVFAGRKICHDSNASVDEAIASFVSAMNKKAADIGAVDSKFVNPDGYDAKDQYTTAYDLAHIAEAFMKSDVLRDITNQHRISDVWLSGQEVTYSNTNELINPKSPYYYKNAVGGKTGTSDSAGDCLVSGAYINNELYICVVMGSTDEGRWRDSLALYHAIRQ